MGRHLVRWLSVPTVDSERLAKPLFKALAIERQASALAKTGVQVFPQAALDRVLVEEAFLVADFFGAGSKGARKRPV